MATDGLWSVWKVKEVTQFMAKALNHPAKPGLKELTREVLEETILHRRCQDNCSMLVMKFKNDKQQQIYKEMQKKRKQDQDSRKKQKTE